MSDAVKVVNAGVCGVDTGTIWIGDPSYILHRTGKERRTHLKEVGKDWEDFCSMIKDDQPATQFDFANGNEGLGVLLQQFGGDGTYVVEVFLDKNGLVTEARIKFR